MYMPNPMLTLKYQIPHDLLHCKGSLESTHRPNVCIFLQAMGFSKQQYDSMAPVAAHPSANTFPGWGSYTTLTSPVTVQANQPACSRSQHVMREQNAVDNRTKSQALIVRVDSALHHDKGMKCTNDALHPPMLSTPCDGDISLPYVKGVITSP